jgi:hypothetical protein
MDDHALIQLRLDGSSIIATGITEQQSRGAGEGQARLSHWNLGRDRQEQGRRGPFVF